MIAIASLFCVHEVFEIARTYLRAHFLTRDNLIFVHAYFLPRTTLCAFISIACVGEILAVYSVLLTHLNYLNYNKIYSHTNKKYTRVFYFFLCAFSNRPAFFKIWL